LINTKEKTLYEIRADGHELFIVPQVYSVAFDGGTERINCFLVISYAYNKYWVSQLVFKHYDVLNNSAFKQNVGT